MAVDYSNQKLISNVYEGMGYSPICVASALSICELSTKNASSVNVVELLLIMKSLLYELQQINGSSSFLGSEETLTDLFKACNSTFLESSIILFDSLTKIEIILQNLSVIGNITLPLVNKLQSKVLELEKEINYELKSKDTLECQPQNGFPNVYTGKNCAELRARGDVSSGVRTVYPFGIFNGQSIRAVMTYCDQTTDGGGWTVFQNRDAQPIRENFYRTWDDYVTGFGDLQGEFWLGLDNIHAMVNSSKMEMRVDLEDYDGAKAWAKYGNFYIGHASTKYTLKIDEYSGNAGDSLIEWHNGMKFSTHDQDNDLDSGTSSCSTLYRGAWWYKNCHASNLNGYQYVGKQISYADGVIWSSFRGHYYSIKKSSMKFRPV